MEKANASPLLIFSKARTLEDILNFRYLIKWQVFKNNCGRAVLGIVILNLEFLTWISKDGRTWI